MNARASRRVGAENSTRDALLDAVEDLMLESGHASVSYRAVAGRAGVTGGLVQYYFPTRDELFVAAIRRRSEENVERLRAALRERPEQPLHVLWDYSRREATAAITMEFLALGNHLESVRQEIAESTEQVRRIQLDALRAVGADPTAPGSTGATLPREVVAYITTGMPKLIRLEQRVGVTLSHEDVLSAFERFLDELEPSSDP